MSATGVSSHPRRAVLIRTRPDLPSEPGPEVTMLRRIALPAAAAALAIAASAPFVAQVAGAQRILPGDTPTERLQQENRQLRQELQLALQQRQDLALGLDRLEQVNRTNRDGRSARRMASLIHDLEVRTGLD